MFTDSDDSSSEVDGGEDAVDDSQDMEKAGSYVVVRVYTENKASFRYYVCKVLNVMECEIEVQFLQRLSGTYKFKDTDEKSYIRDCDIVCQKLPLPISSSSGRFKNYISFAYDLTDFSPLY